MRYYLILLVSIIFFGIVYGEFDFSIDVIDEKPFFASSSFGIKPNSDDVISFHGVNFTYPSHPDPPVPGAPASTKISFADGQKESISKVGPVPQTILTKHENPQAGIRINSDQTISLLVSVEPEKVSPLKQEKIGVPFYVIQCKNSLFLIQKYDNTPACVKLETIQSLIQRGWATELKSVPLKMPTSNSWLGRSGVQVDHIMINETNLDLSYNIVGGKLISVSGHGLCSSGVGKIPQTSLFLTLDAKESGTLTLFLPRSLIDSKVGENDDNFFVVLDEKEISYYETKTDSDRTIAIKFPSSAKEIQVIGRSFCNESFDFTK